MQNIADIRKEYTKATLDINTVDESPLVQFGLWFKEALESKVPEPNAMTLATINAEGRPSCRVVLLKGIEDNKFQFFTNYQSKKGRELELNPACALTFFWPDLERQIRIEGMASRLDEKKSEEYFKSRPRGSQIGAWSSPQSSRIKNREILEERKAKLEDLYLGVEQLPRPHQWGGYGIEPILIEFWQGRASRLHDRIQYTFEDGVWQIDRLAP